ncbi:MAG: branched chain amino acid aminotransferase, partial [Balneolaceae bacterium]
MKIKTVPSKNSRISEVDFDKLDFGRTFSDHMFEMSWSNGSWNEPEIKPYGKISFTPALNVLHYGQAVFEGMKGYYVDDEILHLFRPKDHHQRLNKSSTRLCIPTTSYEVFIEALETLLTLDSDWVPQKKGRALYIRPVVFACEEYLEASVS